LEELDLLYEFPESALHLIPLEHYRASLGPVPRPQLFVPLLNDLLVLRSLRELLLKRFRIVHRGVHHLLFLILIRLLVRRVKLHLFVIGALGGLDIVGHFWGYFFDGGDIG
jgi:hypothetical protein